MRCASANGRPTSNCGTTRREHAGRTSRPSRAVVCVAARESAVSSAVRPDTRCARVRPPGPDGLAGRGVGRHTPVRTRVKAVHALVSDGSECRTMTPVQCTGALRIRNPSSYGVAYSRTGAEAACPGAGAAAGERRCVQIYFTYHDSPPRRVPYLSTGHCSPVAARCCRCCPLASVSPLLSRRLAASTPHWPRVVARGHS